MTTIYDHLKAEQNCPVCCQPKADASEFQEKMGMVRYTCGAAFGVSHITKSIEVFEPCPTPSLVAASHMMMEFGEKQRQRNATKDGA